MMRASTSMRSRSHTRSSVLVVAPDRRGHADLYVQGECVGFVEARMESVDIPEDFYADLQLATTDALLAAGAGVNGTDARGRTALHCTTRRGLAAKQLPNCSVRGPIRTSARSMARFPSTKPSSMSTRELSRLCSRPVRDRVNEMPTAEPRSISPRSRQRGFPAERPMPSLRSCVRRTARDVRKEPGDGDPVCGSASDDAVFLNG